MKSVPLLSFLSVLAAARPSAVPTHNPGDLYTQNTGDNGNIYFFIKEVTPARITLEHERTSSYQIEFTPRQFAEALERRKYVLIRAAAPAAAATTPAAA